VPAGLPATSASLASEYDAAEQLERAGDLDGAAARYHYLVELASTADAYPLYSRALRRLAVLSCMRGNEQAAREYCDRSLRTALGSGDRLLAAEALITRATIDYESGHMEQALDCCNRALEFGREVPAIRARAEQTLGILANIRGDLDAARTHYRESLNACEEAGDLRGCGMVYNNLGMLLTDREMWHEAGTFFERGREVARSIGDARLEALCSLNQAEAHHAVGSYDSAMASAQWALDLFEKMESITDKADAYRLIGMVYRDTKRHVLAEARLTAPQLGLPAVLVA
jgi:tetratricopeptide (TPR) repeat protein